MQLIDRVTTAGYSYVSPTVDRACNVLPLLGSVKGKIEPLAPPLIQKADYYIDTVYDIAEGRVSALRGIVASTGEKVLDLKMSASCKAQSFLDESAVVARVHKTSLALVDTLDMLIDRYLPEPSDSSSDSDEAQKVKAAQSLIPRVVYMPFKIPVRMVHITVVKMQNGCEVVRVNVRWAIQLTSDQKAKLKALIVSQSQAIADRASTSSVAVGLKKGKAGASEKLQAALDSLSAGKKAVGVKCYVVCERLHVIEVKDMTCKKVEVLCQATTDTASGIFISASQRAFDVTSFVAGKERATGLFQMIGKKLPIVKAAIRSSASTGALSDTSSTEADIKVASSTGLTGQEAPAPAVADEEFHSGGEEPTPDESTPEKHFQDTDYHSAGDVDSAGYLSAGDVDSAGYHSAGDVDAMGRA